MGYMLKQVANMRAAGARIPDGYEAAAAVEAIIEAWAGWDGVETTARMGVSEADRELIPELIRYYGLSCSPDEVEQALVRHCQALVRQAAEELARRTSEEE